MNFENFLNLCDRQRDRKMSTIARPWWNVSLSSEFNPGFPKRVGEIVT